jgi:hypothetical protein
MLINSIACLILGELNSVFTTFGVSRVFPFRTNALFEKVEVGIRRKVVNLTDIVKSAMLFF